MKIEDAKARLGVLEKIYESNEHDEEWLEAEGMNIGSEMIALRSAILAGPDEEGNVEIREGR